MARQKQSKRIQITVFIAGLIFACGGIWFLARGIYTYINQFSQTHWPTATATVISVDAYRSGRNKRSAYYNILYQYEAEGTVYTGEIRRTNASRELGETFEVKYNPDAQEESTRYLEPTFGIVVSGIIGFILFGFAGYRMMRSALPKNEDCSSEPAAPQSTNSRAKIPQTVPWSYDVMEIRQNEERIFHEVCDMVRTLKEKHPLVGYVVRLECSDPLDPNGDMPARYSSWIFVSLCRNHIILESGADSEEWPGACDEIIRVKGKNGKLTISDSYSGILSADLEAVTAAYESSDSSYVENKAASDEMLAQARCAEWIE